MAVDVVVRKGEDFDDVLQCPYSSDEYSSAWAPSRERDGLPAEQLQDVRVAGVLLQGDGDFASEHMGSCRVDCGGCSGVECFVEGGFVFFLVFRLLEAPRI